MYVCMWCVRLFVILFLFCALFANPTFLFSLIVGKLHLQCFFKCIFHFVLAAFRYRNPKFQTECTKTTKWEEEACIHLVVHKYSISEQKIFCCPNKNYPISWKWFKNEVLTILSFPSNSYTRWTLFCQCKWWFLSVQIFYENYWFDFFLHERIIVNHGLYACV